VGKRVIKRYVTRKFFDAATGKYLTLHDIYEIVRLHAREDTVEVVEMKGGADVTAVTIANAIYERLRTGGKGPRAERLAAVIRAAR
jgi:polyhydroxyalkanoate synthesis regulator protein